MTIFIVSSGPQHSIISNISEICVLTSVTRNIATDQIKSQKQLGEVIRDKRKLAGYSQEGFASQCGVHRTYMGAIERGERNISLLNIIRISKALKMKPSELFKLAKL